jgi:hypothetical protein
MDLPLTVGFGSRATRREGNPAVTTNPPRSSLPDRPAPAPIPDPAKPPGIDPAAARSVRDDTPDNPRRLGPLGIVLGALGIAAILATAIIGALYGPVGP